MLPKCGPVVWLGQSADTSSICAGHPELTQAPFLTSLGCAIRRPSLLKSHFNGALKNKLGITGPLMVDSGGFVLSTKPNSRWSIETVADCIAGIDADAFVSLDYPPGIRDSSLERLEKIDLSIENFGRLSDMFQNKKIIPVIHGRTLREIEYSSELIAAHTPKPKWVGLGGLVAVLQRRRLSGEIAAMTPERFIGQTLSIVRRVFPSSIIHVFGAGGTRTFPALFALGADSGDSIGWRQMAGFGSILLPLKGERTVSLVRAKRRLRRLSQCDLAQLEVCVCPICRSLSSIESRLGAFQRNFYNRSIHNAWTIVNQYSFWPKTRSEMMALLESGGLGRQWAKAASSIR